VAGRDPHPGQPYETACREWVRNKGLAERVTFVGFVDDIADFYRAIDVAVVPSLSEPLGLIPLEAAAAGKPAIAFASGGLKETITHGETGWLVPAGDVDGLRETLTNVLSDPASLASRGQTARRGVEHTSDPREHLRSLERLYGELLANRGRQG
jgi:glycosyltransferase involved in cell wall biosynthesis